MKPNFGRRYRRRSTASKSEGSFFKKEGQDSFFGNAEHSSFFQPAAPVAQAQSVQRKCDDCEKEDKVQRAEDKKEEEKVMKAPDKKEEEKVQRAEDKKEEDKKVQKKENAASSSSSGKSVGNYIGALNGKGQALPPAANKFFSSRMGYDFSNVKLHTDKDAAESAKGINAKAYAVGNNIVFNEGQFDMQSQQGKKLMAHELTHIVQQNPAIKREPVDAGVPPPAAVQKSAIAQELEAIWYAKGKTAFFERLRLLKPEERNDTDTHVFIIDNLSGDENWFATGLLSWGPESGWNFTDRIELEIRSLPQSRGYTGVTSLLKSADTSQKRNVMQFMLPRIKGRLAKKEFANVLAALDLPKLLTGADDNQKKWMLGDDEVLALLKQELPAQQFVTVITSLIDLSHLPKGGLRDALVELLYSSDEIDRNTARAVIDGRIVIHYMEDLKHPADEAKILKENAMDPAVFTVFIRPDGSGKIGVIQKNFIGFNIRGTNMILGKKGNSVEKWKTLLVHETNHSLNDPGPSPLITYQSEFRAYWVAEFRHVADLDDRARQVKEVVLKTYIQIKEAYNSDANVKKAIDAYTRPDGNITNK